ncbi:MAG: MFS transporter [Candidatus Bathyarchaeota archaeon]|nr:MFS transporter [Candidatus Bathyarchaeota archaeon]
MTVFIDMTGFGMVIPLLPFYAATFQVGAFWIGVLTAAFCLMQFIFSPILGQLSDRMGRKPVLLLSILVSSASFTLFTLSNSFFLLLLSRIIAGIATEGAVAQAYIVDITNEKERTKGLGRVSAAHGAGLIIGPAIGGSLSIFGFWAPGITAVALTLLNLLFVFFFLPESIGQKHPPQRKTVVLDYFVGLPRKIVDLISRPLIGYVLTIFFLQGIAHSTIPVILPLLGASFFGFGAVEMSYLFIYIGFTEIILQGFLIGKISRRFDDVKLIAVGALLMMLGMLFVSLSPNFLLFILSVTLVACGIGILMTVVRSFISKRSLASEQGSIMGITNSVLSIATIFGPLIGGFLFDFVGLNVPFLLNAIMLMAAFAFSIKIIQSNRGEKE